ncbi:uncharacterized protein AMSG_03162 [Thecamonas trahens ATCC 50062]|uniref:Mitochondrial import receptor subunit TOM22 n=1 Tax=Thecamonas trahens ATCC 50062 TaxID=461836 RepID=A0A0L0D348_THETB|nr:hypothetical protein AMSG_03162 [Thecamonas trahens ATCC 50062]KNC46734.1 hypothetical protein AMSG_03162 [Thecamonas trahens ATCC 50062]|eukprot:XP_013760014.1 hypothetical protein AMSG_03162 [Thecamonas trahens ATCC 50062]
MSETKQLTVEQTPLQEWSQWIWKHSKVAALQLGRYAWIVGSSFVVAVVPLAIELERQTAFAMMNGSMAPPQQPMA